MTTGIESESVRQANGWRAFAKQEQLVPICWIELSGSSPMANSV